VLTGDAGRALGLFGDLPARSASVPAARTDALTFRGVARLWAGDLPAAAEDLAEAVSRISAGAGPVPLPGAGLPGRERVQAGLRGTQPPSMR